MNKVIILVLLVSNLFANENHNKATLELFMKPSNVVLEYNCKRKNLSNYIFFTKAKYFENDEMNNIFKEICEDKDGYSTINAINLINIIEKHANLNTCKSLYNCEYYGFGFDSIRELKNTTTKAQLDSKSINYNFSDINFIVRTDYNKGMTESYFKSIYKFKVKSIKEAKLTIKRYEPIDYKILDEYSSKTYDTEHFKLIYDNKNFKTTDENRSLFYKADIFTNTYNMNELKECIDGEVWIKKYGKKSGKPCSWIRKDNKIRFPL